MRSIWNGTLLLGQIPVPIKLHSAVESKTISFREVHVTDGAKIEHRRFCSAEGKEVDYDEVVKGYEVAADEWVVLDKEEIDAAAGERSKIIELEEFVPGGDIDPVFYDNSYYLGVGKDGDETYRLLHAALEQTERVALGRFTFHNREYLAAIRPLDGGVLALHTMRFADELVDAGDVDVPTGGRKPSDREIEMAGRLLQGLQADFEPDRYEDTYRDAVLEVIARKAKGEEIEAPEDEDTGEAPDLLAALEASLGDGKGNGKGDGRGRSGSGGKRKGGGSSGKGKGGKRSSSKSKARS